LRLVVSLLLYQLSYLPGHRCEIAEGLRYPGGLHRSARRKARYLIVNRAERQGAGNYCKARPDLPVRRIDLVALTREKTPVPPFAPGTSLALFWLFRMGVSMRFFPLSSHRQQGKLGWILLWALGIPIPVLLILYLLRGCT
jgi:hypothetical protein